MLGAIVDVLVDYDKNLKAIFYQTPEMQNNFRLYPELVLIDATYKLNDLQAEWLTNASVSPRYC